MIDVRTPVEFREMHVEGARNLPLDQLDPAEVVRGRRGADQDPFYLVCRSGSRGRQACEKFLAAGYTNVVNVEGGTLACIECGLPIARGKKAHDKRRTIAERLGITPSAVGAHSNVVRLKLGVRDNAAVAAWVTAVRPAPAESASD